MGLGHQGEVPTPVGHDLELEKANEEDELGEDDNLARGFAEMTDSDTEKAIQQSMHDFRTISSDTTTVHTCHRVHVYHVSNLSVL